MARTKTIFLLLLWVILALPASQRAHAQAGAPLVLVLTADGPLTPAMRDYLKRGIQEAEQRGAEALVLQLNTPGGSIQLLLDMIKAIRNSSVPVVVYVTPRGTGAFSAGAMLTLSAHASAMAPETAIGAASPVDSSGQDLSTTEKAKTSEAIKAQVIPLVRRRGDQAVALAEAMVDEAKAVSASEALQVGLVDFIAVDLPDLLRQMDGFVVQTTDGEQTLHTAGAVTEELPMSFIEQLLGILVNPNVVFLLLSIGVQAILIELSSPGGWVAGFIGACCLALAAYGLGVLPVNWFGALFILISFVLFILDVKAPTHGALTAAGIGSLIVGGLVLFNSPGVPSFQRVSLPLVIGTAVITGVFFGIVVGFAVRAQKTPIRMGREVLPRKTGIARTSINPTGQVQSGGELWTAELEEGADPVRAGEGVEIVSSSGIHLKVRRLE